MPRPLHLVILLLIAVLVASLEEPSDPVQAEVEPALNNANDLDADATSYGGYGRPWRYGWNNWGWRTGYNWGGRRGWIGRGGWW